MAYRQLITPNIDIGAKAGWCLQYVDDALGAAQGNRSKTAQIAYEMAKENGMVKADQNYPRNVWFVMFWSIDNGEYAGQGHVALAYVDNNGSMQIHGSEVHRGARQPYTSLAEIAGWFGSVGTRLTYLGWSTGVDGVKLIENDGMAESSSRLKGKSKMECLVICRDDLGAPFLKGRVFFWSADAGFKYLEHPDDMKILDEISSYTIGKPMLRKDTSKAAPWHMRLAQVNGACDIK